MKVGDRHISEALRLAGITDVMLVTSPPAYVLAHALTLAKLECAVEALQFVHAHIPTSDAWHLVHEALTQIRSESHE